MRVSYTTNTRRLQCYCVYTHTHMQTHAHRHTHMHTRAHRHTHTHRHTHNTHTHTQMHTHVLARVMCMVHTYTHMNPCTPMFSYCTAGTAQRWVSVQRRLKPISFPLDMRLNLAHQQWIDIINMALFMWVGIQFLVFIFRVKM
jgi:hypothetical protein